MNKGIVGALYIQGDTKTAKYIPCILQKDKKTLLLNNFYYGLIRRNKLKISITKDGCYYTASFKIIIGGIEFLEEQEQGNYKLSFDFCVKDQLATIFEWELDNKDIDWHVKIKRYFIDKKTCAKMKIRLPLIVCLFETTDNHHCWWGYVNSEPLKVENNIVNEDINFQGVSPLKFYKVNIGGEGEYVI